MIPPNNEELDDTLTSDESGSDEDIYDPDMTKLQLRSIFHKKYYKKCKNDARVKMTMVNGKAMWCTTKIKNSNVSTMTATVRVQN